MLVTQPELTDPGGYYPTGSRIQNWYTQLRSDHYLEINYM